LVPDSRRGGFSTHKFAAEKTVAMMGVVASATSFGCARRVVTAKATTAYVAPKSGREVGLQAAEPAPGILGVQ
jgi:hypothetical protein